MAKGKSQTRAALPVCTNIRCVDSTCAIKTHHWNVSKCRTVTRRSVIAMQTVLICFMLVIKKRTWRTQNTEMVESSASLEKPPEHFALPLNPEVIRNTLTLGVRPSCRGKGSIGSGPWSHPHRKNWNDTRNMTKSSGCQSGLQIPHFHVFAAVDQTWSYLSRADSLPHCQLRGNQCPGHRTGTGFWDETD